MPTPQDDDKREDHPATPAPDAQDRDAHERDAHEEEVHRRKDELLDQGVEETFPASDPVAVKHIT